MPFFVAIRHQVEPDRREHRLAAIRRDFAASARLYPGRRFARVFDHRDDPGRLLAFEEWTTQADFEQHEQSPAYLATLTDSGPPPHTAPLERVQHFRHLPRRPEVLACTAIAAPGDSAADAEAFICDEERRAALAADGLVLRAVYRVLDQPGHLLVVHGWLSRDYLEVYVSRSAPRLAAVLADCGAATDQFTGQVAAEYSWLES